MDTEIKKKILDYEESNQKLKISDDFRCNYMKTFYPQSWIYDKIKDVWPKNV